MDVAVMTSMSLTSISMRLAQSRSRYDQGAGQLALLEGQREERVLLRGQVADDLTRYHLTQALLTETSEYARQQLTERIEATVTAGLRIILGREDLSFKVISGKLNDKPTADWQVASLYGEGGVEVANSPEESRGGGIVDVVSLTLRLALLELSRPRPEGLVILDEVAKMVSVQYSHNLAAFLRSYAIRTGRQICLVTHNVTLALSGDLIYWVSQQDGVSDARRIEPDELRQLWKDIEDKSQVASEEVP
jgi:hypothetical protein